MAMTSKRKARAGVAVAATLAVGAAAACSSAPRSTEADALLPRALEPRVRPSVDLSGVVTRAPSAFRADGEGFAAGTSALHARMTGGRLVVTPRERTARATNAEAALALETTRIARGSNVLAGPASAARVEADGSITAAHAGIVEHVACDVEGVEQSWRFDEAPRGDGDLVVRVRATGRPELVAVTDHGLHFAARKGLGLRYGTATWVDARGTRTTVMPRMVGTDIVLVVPNDVVSASAYPAVLDPTILAESEIDKPVSGSSASGEQYNPAIASLGSGKGYLAVWYDGRGVRPALYGARIASDGTVLDGTGIPIATGIGSTVPSIASSPNGLLVTWAISYVDLYQSPGVYAVRLDAQGNPIDPAPVTVVANETNVQLPTAAFDGTAWLVAWQRYGGAQTSYDIAGVRVPATGPVTPAAAIEIGKGLEAEYQPLVTFDGTNHFVTWRSSGAVFARRVGQDGKPIGDRVTLAASAGSNLSAFHTAFDGTQHLVVWSDYVPASGSYDVFGRRIALAGTPIDPGYIGISTDASYDERPRAVWDGASFVVAWSRSGALLASRVSAAGAVLDAPIGIAPGTDYYDFRLASDGTSSLAVARAYGGSSLTGSDVTGVRIGKPPAAAAPFVVSRAANSETEPATAFNGTTHMAAWLDTRDGRPAIYGAPVSPDGQPGAAVKLVSDAVRFPNELTRPRIASDGAGFLLVFYAYDQSAMKRGIRGLRLDAAGNPSGAIFDVYVPLSVNEYPREPDVAFDGTNYLVVWENQTNDAGSQTSIVGYRFGTTGTAPVDKEPLRITSSNPVEQRLAPSIAFDGTNYFVAWVTSRPAAAGGIEVSHIHGSRVSKEGTLLDGEQVVCNAFLLQRAPSVAADAKDGGFMVVWEDYRTALETADVYGARISKEGQNLDGTSGMKIAAAAPDESRPRVAPSGDGTNWVVTWRDLRSKQTYDIYGAWVSRAGKVHDPDGLAISADTGDEDAPWIASSTAGKLLVAYQRLDPRTGYGSYRVRARSIVAGAKVADACTKNDDCASRSCVDGICCASECGGCGQCNVTPGTCTPRAAGAETATCPAYKCKGTLECPATCAGDQDCASNATCDPASKTCVSRVICIDDHTLKDLGGKLTECAPFKCTADACRTQCGSVDDCAAGFVCDYGGRCVQPPTPNEGSCALEPAPRTSRGSFASLGGLAALAALAFAARRGRR